MTVLARPSVTPSNAQLTALLDSVDEALVLFDTRRRVAFCNQAATRLLGCSVGQGPEAVLARLPEAVRPAVRGALAGAEMVPMACLGAHGQRLVLRVRTGAAGTRLLLASAAPAPVFADAALATSGDADLGQGEPATRELERWFDLSPIGMLVYDDRGLVVRCNLALEALIGRAPVMLADAPEDLRRLLGWSGQGRHAQLEPDSAPVESRAVLLTPDGRRLGLRARLRAFLAAEGAVRVMAVVEDRSLEEERDLAQLEIGALMDTAGVGVATYEASRGWLPSRAARHGAASGAAATPGLQSIRRDQVEAASLPEYERLQQALREGRRVQVRYAVQVPGLGARWLLTRVEPGELTGGRSALSVVTLDVTEQEESHRRSEQLLRELSTILDGTTAGIAYLRGERLVRSNRRFESMLDLPQGEAAGAWLQDLFAGEPAVVVAVRQALAQDGRVEIEWLRRPATAALGAKWFALSVRRAGTAEQPEAVAVLTDVSRLKAQQADLERVADERRSAREALQLQAERTRAILDSVLVGIITVSDAGIEWMNRSARRMFGGELADFVGEPISIVAPSEPDHPLRRTHYLSEFGDGQAETFECRLRGRDGREFWVVGNAVVTGRESTGSQITFALLDIERRRQAEISIAQAQVSLQRIIETAPLAIALFEAGSARVLRLNQMAGMFFGQTLEAVLGRAPEDWFEADAAQQLRADLERAGAQGDPLRREIPRPSRADGAGETRVWDVRIVSLAAAGDAQLLLVASDVTEQRAAEQARFEAAVSQREMLVKEVHHRIKNNLQGVAGLLQQTAVRRPEVATLIGEVVGQVQAIAQVHGLQVGASGPLRVQPVLEAITASVQRTFGRDIQVQVHGAAAHRYSLPEAESIPIALTINELLTNAVKHGLPGPVRCSLHCDEAGVEIAIASPGCLRDGFSLAQVPPGVSGLGLVRSLLPRRSATLTLADEGGEVVARVSLRPPSITLVGPL